MEQMHPPRGRVVYIRGLNSQGDDQLRFGRLSFGTMHGPWLKRLHNSGIDALALTGFANGSLEAQIERATAIFEREIPKDRPIHLVGHSLGGLIARALPHRIEAPNILSVITLAAPHRGSPLADWIPQLPQRRPFIHRAFHILNYRIEDKLTTFRDLGTKAMEEFNLKYFDLPRVHYASGVFQMPLEKMSWPVALAHHLVKPKNATLISDGFVEVHSQTWGEVLWRDELDHLEQIGHLAVRRPRRRKWVEQRLNLMLAEMKSYWLSVEKEKL